MNSATRTIRGTGVGASRAPGPASLRERWTMLKRRRHYLVNPEFQFLIIRQSMLSLLIGIGVGLCARYVLASFSDSAGGGELAAIVGLVYVIVLAATGAGAAFLLSLFFSQRIAGPSNKIRDALWRIAEGDVSFSIRLRRTDMLQDLAGAVNANTRNWRILLDDLERELHACAVSPATTRSATGPPGGWTSC